MLQPQTETLARPDKRPTAKTVPKTASKVAPKKLAPDTAQPDLDTHRPVVRLHLWLESGEGMFFGSGRAKLLSAVEKNGSLRKAAESMGMSYRAAWGKIKQSEKALGVSLLAARGSRREGVRLTRFGRMLMELFETWFDAVEKEALHQADLIFPWANAPFSEARREDDGQ